MTPPITDATIARIAGNILSSDVEDWLPGGDRRMFAVRAAVATARAIVAEVEKGKEPEK